MDVAARVARRRPAIRGAAAAILAGLVAVAEPAAAAGPRTSAAAGRADSLAAADATAAPAGDSARRKTMAYELVRFGRNVHVHADEIVRGDVLLLGGELRVDGEIQGGAVVIGGDIHAGPEARIGGQAVAVSGRVSSAPGAELHGAVSLSVLSGPLWARFGAGPGGDLLGDVLQLLLWILLALPLCAWGRPLLARAGERLDRAPLKCFGLGVLALPGGAFAIVVIAFLLALTLFGVPLAILLVVGALAAGWVALVVGAATIGARVRAALPGAGDRRLLNQVVLGLVFLRAPELIADLLAFIAPAHSLRPLHVLDAGIEGAAIAAGFGALLWMQWAGTVQSPRRTPTQ